MILFFQAKGADRDMKKYRMHKNHLAEFHRYLISEERSKLTIEKYIRDVHHFFDYVDITRKIGKEDVLDYKESLKKAYKASSINSMLTALNTFFSFLGYDECKVKLLKQQKRVFLDQSKELTLQEYQRLLKTAQKKENERLYMLMQTICATGIRISELNYITVESLKSGRVLVDNKGKLREIILPNQLQKKLARYCHLNKIKQGIIFITKSGRAMNRSNIWKSMKGLCEEAGVDHKKVFPHNLRHLFACTYYKMEKDIVRLADLLGHSSVETARIYTMTSSTVYSSQLSKMGLVT